MLQRTERSLHQYRRQLMGSPVRFVTNSTARRNPARVAALSRQDHLEELQGAGRSPTAMKTAKGV